MKVIPREVITRKSITWSREIRDLQARLELVPFQKEVLIGTILGDACLIANVGKKNYRLQVEHSTKQKDYVWWKYSIFKEWVLSEPKFIEGRNSWRFRTISHPSLTAFHELFYKEGKKILPSDIDQLLNNPISLGVWFMDDGALGNKRKNAGLVLNTQGFSLRENQRLQKCLKGNFNLDTSLHKDKTSWRIYILSHSALLFNEIVKDVILPEFRYKLSFIDPVET